MPFAEQAQSEANLYDLTRPEFECLALSVLPNKGYTNTRYVAGGRHGSLIQAIDRESGSVLVQILHKRELTASDIQTVVQRMRNISDGLEKVRLLIITSAEVSAAVRKTVDRLSKECSLELMDRDSIFTLTQQSPEAVQTLTNAHTRTSWRVATTVASAMISMVLTIFMASSKLWHPKQASLDQQIQNVEKALASMHDLEEYLANIKNETIATQKATERVKKDYAQAQELKKLSAVQIEAIQSAILNQRWWDSFISNLIAFILGVASSLFASGMIFFIKRRIQLGRQQIGSS